MNLLLKAAQAAQDTTEITATPDTMRTIAIIRDITTVSIDRLTDGLSLLNPGVGGPQVIIESMTKLTGAIECLTPHIGAIPLTENKMLGPNQGALGV